MVSFETLRTFEMILAVSLTRLSSRLTSKDSLVENLTIVDNGFEMINGTPLDGYEDRYLREYASAFLKKVEHSPVKEKCSM